MSLTDVSLSILDLAKADGTSAERAAFLDDLCGAARGPRVFYIVGHGIAAETPREVLALSCRFFALREIDKLAIDMVKSAHFRGYGLPASKPENHFV
jgi:isopenicillin N synthase-like dioxygenase